MSQHSPSLMTSPRGSQRLSHEPLAEMAAVRTFKKKMSAHCMQGYMICAADSSSDSVRPMICPHRKMRFRLFLLAMSITSVQYSSGLLFISSEVFRNSTCIAALVRP